MKKRYVIYIILIGIIIGLGTNILAQEKVLVDNDHVIYHTSKERNKFATTHLHDDQIKLEISNNSLALEGRTINPSDDFMVDIYDANGEMVLREEGEVRDNHHYSYAKTLGLEDGVYELVIYHGTREGNQLQWKVNYLEELSLTLLVENKVVRLERPIVYEENMDKLNENNSVKEKHVDLKDFDDEEKLLLRNKLGEIVGEETDDYKKAFLISKWVSENIYYDYDSLDSGDYHTTDAIGTLKSKRSVCQGYAELTDALLKTAGIPSRLTVGYGLGGFRDEDERWKDVKEEKSNHIWNEAYVKDRWVIIDTTWNSGNKYEEGEFIRGRVRYNNFDMTLENFSRKHRIEYRY